VNAAIRKKLLIWVGLACGTGLAAAQPYQAGLRSFNVPYGDREIEATVWYPTRAAEETQSFGPYTAHVAVAAPPVDGRFPLVLVSHGTGGTRMNHHVLAEALARSGIVVASLTHPGDNYRDRSLIADPRYFYDRPRQISRVLDALLAGAWKDHIDERRIGAIGHSAGGFSVLALIGGVPDGARMIEHCKHSSDDPACQYIDPTLGVTDPLPAFKPPPTSSASGDVRDPRIRAALLLAPAGAMIAPGSLKSTPARVKIIGAEHDEVLARRYHYDYLRAEMPQASVRLAANAGHYAFIAPVAPSFRAALGPVAADPAGFDRAVFQAALAQETVDFFKRALQLP